MFDALFHLASHLTFRLHFHPPSRLDYRRKTTANESLSITLSQPPAFPFSSYLFPLSLYFRQRRSTPFHPICFPFPCTLGNDDRLSATAAWHSYAPEPFLFIFADIFFIFPSTIFVNVRHNDYTFTYPSPMLTLLPTDTITKA